MPVRLGRDLGRRLLPASVYEKLPTGPGFARDYEIQAGVPIDGSNGLLRDPVYGSPFTLSILPPDALINALSAKTGTDGEVPVDVTLISAATRADPTFSTYKNKIERFRASSTFLYGNSASLNVLENFVTEGGFVSNDATMDPTGNVPALSDLRQAASVVLQLNRILQVPPLTLLINPQSLSITYAKKQNYTERTRANYRFQSWGGEEQVRLSITGKTGAYIAGGGDLTQSVSSRIGTTPTATNMPTGVQFASRRDSAAWQNLQSLITFYRNNGYIYDTLGGSEAHLWIGAIAIEYDQWTYIGHFESFEYGFTSETQNGGQEFSMEFTCDRIYDNAKTEFIVLPEEAPTPGPSDPRWYQPSKKRREPNQFDLVMDPFVNPLVDAVTGDSAAGDQASTRAEQQQTPGPLVLLPQGGVPLGRRSTGVTGTLGGGVGSPKASRAAVRGGEF